MNERFDHNWRTDEGWVIRSALGHQWSRGHCVPLALARAAARDPLDNLGEVVTLAERFAADLTEAGMLNPGTGLATCVERWKDGDYSIASYAEAVGVPFVAQARFGSWVPGLRNRLPTVAQICRALPEGDYRVLVGATRHVGLIRAINGRAETFALRPRQRVDEILILEGP